MMRFVSFIVNYTFIANSINEVYHQNIGIAIANLSKARMVEVIMSEVEFTCYFISNK